MKKIASFSTILIVLLSLSYYTQAQPTDSASAMKMWMDYMVPGTFHKMLAKDEGSWTEETTFWMTPGAPPTTSSMSSENKMIMGGRYQQSIHKGTVNGMPFEGISTVGYDNAKKVFFSTWIDNMGTGLTYMEGKYNPVMKNITFLGKMVDPMSGKDKSVREVFTMIDDNNQTITMFYSANGKEYKSMEIHFKRKM